MKEDLYSLGREIFKLSSESETLTHGRIQDDPLKKLAITGLRATVPPFGGHRMPKPGSRVLGGEVCPGLSIGTFQFTVTSTVQTCST